MLSRLIITPNPWRYNTEMIECISNPDIVPGNLDEENLVWGWGEGLLDLEVYPKGLSGKAWAFMNEDDMMDVVDMIDWIIPPTQFGSLFLEEAIRKCQSENRHLLILDRNLGIIDEFV